MSKHKYSVGMPARKMVGGWEFWKDMKHNPPRTKGPRHQPRKRK